MSSEHNPPAGSSGGLVINLVHDRSARSFDQRHRTAELRHIREPTRAVKRSRVDSSPSIHVVSQHYRPHHNPIPFNWNPVRYCGVAAPPRLMSHHHQGARAPTKRRSKQRRKADLPLSRLGRYAAPRLKATPDAHTPIQPSSGSGALQRSSSKRGRPPAETPGSVQPLTSHETPTPSHPPAPAHAPFSPSQQIELLRRKEAALVAALQRQQARMQRRARAGRKTVTGSRRPLFSLSDAFGVPSLKVPEGESAALHSPGGPGTTERKHKHGAATKRSGSAIPLALETSTLVQRRVAEATNPHTSPFMHTGAGARRDVDRAANSLVDASEDIAKRMSSMRLTVQEETITEEQEDERRQAQRRRTLWEAGQAAQSPWGRYHGLTEQQARDVRQQKVSPIGDRIVGWKDHSPHAMTTSVGTVLSSWFTDILREELESSKITWPLSREQAEIVDYAFKYERVPAGRGLCTETAGGTDVITELVSLRPRTWLSDEVINGYLKLVKARSDRVRASMQLSNDQRYWDTSPWQSASQTQQEDKQLEGGSSSGDSKTEDMTEESEDQDEVGSVPRGIKPLRVHIYNSFFYSKLIADNYSYPNVRRWSRRAKVRICTGLDKLIFPINLNNTHWTCGCVDFMRKRFEYYDSMHGVGTLFFKCIRQYIKDESKNYEGKEFDFSGWKDVVSYDCPMQTNAYDCGVFCCLFANCLSQDLEFNFSQKDIPQIRRKIAAQILQNFVP